MALLGAAGGIGQPLGLLLKMNKYIAALSLYDIAPFTPGVAKDLSHCNTPSQVGRMLVVLCCFVLPLQSHGMKKCTTQLLKYF